VTSLGVATTPSGDIAAGARSDLRAAWLGEAGAVVGVAGLVTLGLMFALEVPSGGPYRFGTVNDFCGAAFSALFIPVAAQVARRLPKQPRWQVFTRATYAAAVAGAILPLLLVSGALAFETQVPLVVACIELQSLWLVVAGRQLVRVPGLERLGRVSTVVGSSFIVGTALFGAGLLAPADSPLRLGLWAVGGITGAAGYIGWPYWYHAVAGVLRRAARASGG
jgi:hypothetical protein